MNKYVTLYLEERKKKFKKIDLAKKKFKLLSIVEKNSFEQIIERREENYLSLYTIPLKLLFYVGLSIMMLSIMIGISLEVFKPIFILLLPLMMKLSIILIVLGLFAQYLNKIKINKLRFKLLSE